VSAELPLGYGEQQELGRESFGEQYRVVLGLLGAGEPFEQEARVAVDGEAAVLSFFNETVECGVGASSVGMAGPRRASFFPYHEGMDGVLRGAVVESGMAVLHVTDELEPMRESMIQRLAQ
jgi:hypothetical protein